MNISIASWGIQARTPTSPDQVSAGTRDAPKRETPTHFSVSTDGESSKPHTPHVGGCKGCEGTILPRDAAYPIVASAMTKPTPQPIDPADVRTLAQGVIAA